MLPLTTGQLLFQSSVRHMAQYIRNGIHTHFDTGITFSEKLDGILLDHNRSSCEIK
jgi:hypothetical protein